MADQMPTDLIYRPTSQEIPSDVVYSTGLAQQPRTLKQRASDILGAAPGGAIAGALAPELVTGAGLAAAAFPATTLAAPYLLASGAGMRGARLAGAAAGGLMGMGSEALEQGMEALNVPSEYRTPIRMGAEALVPEAGRQIPRALTAAGFRGGMAPTVREGLRDIFTPSPIAGGGESIAKMLRRGAPSTEAAPAERVYGGVASAAEREARSAIGAQRAQTAAREAEREARLRQAGTRLTEQESEAQRVAQGARSSFGQPLREEQFGGAAQQMIAQRLAAGKATREEKAIDDLLTPALQEAQTLQRKNVFPENKPESAKAFAEAMKIAQKIVDDSPTEMQDSVRKNLLGNLKGVTRQLTDAEKRVYALRNNVPLDQVPNTIETPATFEQLINFSRYLNYLSKYGKELSGWEANVANRAQSIAPKLKETLSSYNEKYGQFLNKYQEESLPVNLVLDRKLSQSAVQQSPFLKEFMQSGKATARKFLDGTKESANILVQAVGDDPASRAELERMVMGVFSDRVAKAQSTKQIDDLIRENRGLFEVFPRVGEQVGYLRRTVESAETAGARAKTQKPLIEAKRKERAQIGEEARSADIEKDVEKRVQEVMRLPAGQNKAEAIERMITGSQSVEDIKRIGAYISATPELRNDFVRALEIALSRVDPGKIREVMDRRVLPAIEGSGLVQPKELQRIKTMTRAMELTADPNTTQEVVGFVTRLLRNIGAAEAGRGTSRPLQTLLGANLNATR